MKLEIKNLSKTYNNGVKALNNLTLTVNKGMFGLLGPNGAGKSTLMKTIATIQEADEGSVDFNGIDVFQQPLEIKKHLGYLPQEFGFYPSEKAINLLEHFALLKGIKDEKQRKTTVEYFLQKVNLIDFAHKKIGSFSGGMRQRFGIALALIGNPKLVIVDEPTAGLDPEERNRFHNLLSEVSEDTIVIISTHIVEDVSQLCTDMAIINKGEICYHNNPNEAIKELNGNIYEMEVEKNKIEEIKERFQVLSSRMFTGKTFLRVYSAEHLSGDFKQVTANLEDVYFYHLKKKRG